MNIITLMPMAGPNDKLDLHGSWTKFWGEFTKIFGAGFWTVLAIVGMILVVGSVIAYLMKRRGGGGGGGAQAAQPILWTLVIGILLMTPQWIIGPALKVLDWGGNLIIAILKMIT